MTNKQTMLGFALTCGLLLVLFCLTLFLGEENKKTFLREGGIIESATIFAYVVCVAYIVYKRKTIELKYFFFLVLFFMLRELDFDARFTTMSIFKSRFYISPNVPLIEKAVGVMVIILLIYVAISIFTRHSKAFFTGLKQCSAVAFGALLTLIFLGTSKSIDGLARKLKGLGITVSAQIANHALAVEEIMEFGIPILILLTFSAYLESSRT
jgi:hypothetical protein